jgi:sec-independent protein translocase protein TatA
LAWPRLFAGSSGRPPHRWDRLEDPVEGLMGEGLFQPLHLLIIIAIILLIFGTSKFAALGKGMGEGIRNFKAAMKDPEEEKKEKKEEEKKS